LATANKNLSDFNPSPFSRTYMNPPEMAQWLAAYGFGTQFLAGSPVPAVGARAKLLRWAKRTAVRFHLIPGTMAGKLLLKRIVFGQLVQMPKELDADTAEYVTPQPVPGDRPDTQHLVLYCVATKEPRHV
jgi:hypothetical protein